jgi:hypothetical protein
MSRQAAQLTERLDPLDALERRDLLTLWQKAYDAPPFKGARRGTLLRGISYANQAKVHGGLKAKTKRKLLKIAQNASSVVSPERSPSLNAGQTQEPVVLVDIKAPLPSLQLGSQVVREWNGKTYTVHATDKGLVLNGVTYNSLSAVAKAITGAHWSGPRFFGVSG